MQNVKHIMRFRILLLMTSKNEQSLKQHCHPYLKSSLELPSKINISWDVIWCTLYAINNNLQVKYD